MAPQTGEPRRGVNGSVPPAQRRQSRRWVLSCAAAGACAPLIASRAGYLKAETAQGPAAGGQSPQPRRPRYPQGGTGPIRVLLITGGHGFEREPFFSMFDSFGKEITWTHVEYPAAEVFFDPVNAAPYDVFVLYDCSGRARKPGAEGAAQLVNVEPSPRLRNGMKELLQTGKGMVLFHHAIGSWVLWPEYHEIRGAAAQFTMEPFTVRGKPWPYSPNRIGVQQHITVADKTHPIVQNLGEGFDITDEVFIHPVFEESVHPLLRTDFKRIETNFPRYYELGWRHPEGSSLAAWVKASERSPVVYLQFGHDATAWEAPGFRTLLSNSIRWAASKEALAWAAANRTRIFK